MQDHRNLLIKLIVVLTHQQRPTTVTRLTIPRFTFLSLAPCSPIYKVLPDTFGKKIK